MRIKANKIKELTALQTAADKESAIEEKLDELIALLARSEFDSDTVKHYQQRVNDALENRELNPELVEAFKIIDKKPDASREELLDEFSTLLLSNKIDSKISTKYLKVKQLTRWVVVIIGLVMITLGMAMIIMPAPPYFEMFTIYYFNQNDGVTLMDIISLIVVLSGVYLLIRSFYNKINL